MRFIIEGADVNTGKDRTIRVEARDKEHAEQIAGYHGLLVSAIKGEGEAEMMAADLLSVDTEPGLPPPPLPTLDYAGQPRAGDCPPVPEYKGITRGAQLLEILAGVLLFIGFLSLAAAIVFALVAVTRSPENGEALAAMIFAGGAFWWLLYFIAATILRLLAALAIAHRDMAQNSFRHRA